jgi:hypothetical protein
VSSNKILSGSRDIRYNATYAKLFLLI